MVSCSSIKHHFHPNLSTPAGISVMWITRIIFDKNSISYICKTCSLSHTGCFQIKRTSGPTYQVCYLNTADVIISNIQTTSSETQTILLKYIKSERPPLSSKIDRKIPISKLVNNIYTINILTWWIWSCILNCFSILDISLTLSK